MSFRLSLLLVTLAFACQGTEEFHRRGVIHPGSGGSGSGGESGSGGVTGSGGAGGLPGSGGVGGGAGSGGRSGSGGRTGSGGSTVTPPCTPTKTAPTAQFQSGNLGTSAVCIKLEGMILGWGCSNMESRTLKVNGTEVPTSGTCGGSLPAQIGGAYYFDVSAGTPEWAAFYTY